MRQGRDRDQVRDRIYNPGHDLEPLPVPASNPPPIGPVVSPAAGRRRLAGLENVPLHRRHQVIHLRPRREGEPGVQGVNPQDVPVGSPRRRKWSSVADRPEAVSPLDRLRGRDLPLPGYPFGDSAGRDEVPDQPVDEGLGGASGNPPRKPSGGSYLFWCILPNPRGPGTRALIPGDRNVFCPSGQSPPP